MQSSTRSPSSDIHPHPHLSMSDVANIFIKLRRARAKARKAHHIESTSGEEFLSHTGGLPYGDHRLSLTDTYICTGGVNAKCLLRATRNSLLEMTEFACESDHVGLVEEQWRITICPKHVTGTKADEKGFKVTVHYSAAPTRIDDDPHVPVALDRVQSVPGLMTILHYNP